MRSFGIKCEPQALHYVILERGGTGLLTVLDVSRFQLHRSLTWPARLNAAGVMVRDTLRQLAPDVVGLRVTEHQSLRSGNIQGGTVDRFHLEGVVLATVAGLGLPVLSCNTQQFRAATGAPKTIAEYVKSDEMLEIEGFGALTANAKEAAAAAIFAVRFGEAG